MSVELTVVCVPHLINAYLVERDTFRLVLLRQMSLARNAANSVSSALQNYQLIAVRVIRDTFYTTRLALRRVLRTTEVSRKFACCARTPSVRSVP
jgi:hypothetical protein